MRQRFVCMAMLVKGCYVGPEKTDFFVKELVFRLLTVGKIISALLLTPEGLGVWMSKVVSCRILGSSRLWLRVLILGQRCVVGLIFSLVSDWFKFQETLR